MGLGIYGAYFISYYLLLVRRHRGTHYEAEGLCSTGEQQPAFWDGCIAFSVDMFSSLLGILEIRSAL